MKKNLSWSVSRRVPRPDDLLELGDRVDDAGQDDVLAGGDVDAGGEELGGRGDHGHRVFGVHKAIQSASLTDVALGGCDAHDVIGVAAGSGRG